MVSPMMLPPQIPPPHVPRRSIAGPVVLILMGVLFLLGTMGIMDIHHLGSLFARFWPALLILWGVLKLIEYEQAKRYGQPARGIGVGGVFLMLFLIGAGLIATQASHVDWKNLGDHIQIGDDEGLDEIFGGSTFNYNGKTNPTIGSEGKVLTLNANTQGAGEKSVTTDMDIYVPRNTDLVIVSRRGGVTINGMSGAVEVSNHNGEVSLNDHTGNAVLNLD